MAAKLNVVPRRTRLEVVTDGVTWRVPAPLAAVGLASLALAVILAAFEPQPIRAASLDRQADDLARWEAEQRSGLEATVAGMEAPLRDLRRQALMSGIAPEGDYAPSPCEGSPTEHFAGHAREAARLSAALSAKAAAETGAALALLPSRSPIDLAGGDYLLTDHWWGSVYVSSREGERTDPFDGRNERHFGLDIAAPEGTVVHATADGTVLFAGSVDPNVDHRKSLLGNYVEIEHGRTGFKTLYAHLSRLSVRSGDSVKGGQKIGAVGTTGHSTAPHLHYQVTKGGAVLDPLAYIDDVILTRDGKAIRYSLVHR